ncbi:ABC transporter permease [Microbacterium suaedae]|uniref:ABC transporter permease n=1 Tax=Microbacterium suaedae TaxID=2067813 RepID=UPI000DA240C8|nr:ABC transporter permease [Microbacterium suaedae]
MSETKTTNRITAALIKAWLPLSLVAVWAVGSTAAPSPFFPPLRIILERFWTVWLGEGFVEHVLPSLLNLAIGFAIALVIGIAAGSLLALMPTAALLANPFLQFLRAMPSIALLPVALVLFGTGMEARVALIAYGAIWPILLNTTDGITSIHPGVRQATRSYRFTRANTYFRVLLPGSFPQISLGIRLSLSIALVLMIGSEFYGAINGIGAYVLQSQLMFRTADMWSGVILLGLLGYLLSTGYGYVEDRLLRWREPS